MTKKEGLQLEDKLEDAVRLLAEHFETVQILCSFTAEGETYRFESGSGNRFARIRQAQAWSEFQANADTQSRLDDLFSPEEDERESNDD